MVNSELDVQKEDFYSDLKLIHLGIIDCYIIHKKVISSQTVMVYDYLPSFSTIAEITVLASSTTSSGVFCPLSMGESIVH